MQTYPKPRGLYIFFVIPTVEVKSRMLPCDRSHLAGQRIQQISQIKPNTCQNDCVFDETPQFRPKISMKWGLKECLERMLRIVITR